jgi:NADPH:quinone reductase-like Zn-dependent oxidoreductase
VAVGKKVTRFKPGDEVLGGADGSFAEFTRTTEKRLAPKPAGITFEQAATLNVAGLTALQGLRDRARVRASQRVLVNGAGGGVGTFAVQIAKWLGAHVTGVTRGGSVDLVRSIGADEVIDHKTEDFTSRPDRWDVIFDIGGNRPFSRCRRVMEPDGILIAIGGPAGRWLAPASRLLTAVMLWPITRHRRVVPFVAKSDPEGLAVLGGLVERGTITPVIDRRFPLSETAEAVRHLATGHMRGKVVINTR